MFPSKNGFKQGGALLSLLFNFAESAPSGKPGWLEIKWYTPAYDLC